MVIFKWLANKILNENVENRKQILHAYRTTGASQSRLPKDQRSRMIKPDQAYS